MYRSCTTSWSDHTIWAATKVLFRIVIPLGNSMNRKCLKQILIQTRAN